MSRLVTVLPVVVVVSVAGVVSPASAQLPSNLPQPEIQVAAAYGELHGVVRDDRGEPIGGAVVSALGSATAFAISDGEGRFRFNSLPPGPYLVRAHLQGYIPLRGTIVHVNSSARSVSSITLARRSSGTEPPVLAAGLGSGEAAPPPTIDDTPDADNHSELAWRLRHLKRSVLRETETGVIVDEEDDSFIVDSLASIGRAMGSSARIASALFTDLPVTGQFNLLTSSSLDRPQDLFSISGGPPRGAAHVALTSPTGNGDWSIRGAITQGDLASWIVAGSFVHRAPATHQYEAGLSYSMQRYQGGNAVALRAVSDGSRNAGNIYAFDHWTVVPQVTLSYGARYARYDYLSDDLFSPSLSVLLRPMHGLRLRAAASRRALAPGAEEFVPPGTIGVWLPPERTFSPVTTGAAFQPERMEHFEVAAERDFPGNVVLGVRAFRQRVDDQAVTLFGISLPHSVSADVGHYFVASGGDLEAHGWGVSVSRELVGRVRGSVDYTQSDAEWARTSPDVAVLAVVAQSALRANTEKLHDITTSMETEIPMTATRVYMLCKVNSAFGASQPTEQDGRFGTRFDVQVNQALPFLNFTNAQWEMLLAVRNMFRQELLDASVYDELLVVRPPKRIVGGLTVRF